MTRDQIGRPIDWQGRAVTSPETRDDVIRVWKVTTDGHTDEVLIRSYQAAQTHVEWLAEFLMEDVDDVGYIATIRIELAEIRLGDYEDLPDGG